MNGDRPVHLVVRGDEPIRFGMSREAAAAAAALHVKCHPRLIGPASPVRWTADPARVTCGECLRGLPRPPRTVRCHCGCGTEFQDERRNGAPRKYLDEAHYRAARNRRRRKLVEPLAIAVLLLLAVLFSACGCDRSGFREEGNAPPRTAEVYAAAAAAGCELDGIAVTWSPDYIDGTELGHCWWDDCGATIQVRTPNDGLDACFSWVGHELGHACLHLNDSPAEEERATQFQIRIYESIGCEVIP